MNEEKFKLTLSAPIDKNGMTVKLIEKVEDSTLSLKHYPEFTWYLFGIIFIMGGFFISLLIHSWFWIYCAIFFIIILYYISNARAFICIIDKKTGLIAYHRSGILMTSFDEQKSKHNMSEIKCLQMQRHVKGGRSSLFSADTFQIFVLFDKGQRIAISPKNLDFSECQELSERIRNFIGNEIPIKALD